VAEIARGADGRLVRRAVKRGGLTKAKRETFLRMLALTGNVRMAARAAGADRSSFQSLRGRDTGFAKLWADALAASEGHLREELVARALGYGADPDNPDASVIAQATAAEEADAARRFDPKLALEVLKLRGRTAGAPEGMAPKPMTQGELDAALLARLDAIAARRAEG
jgi:hypothetical protein